MTDLKHYENLEEFSKYLHKDAWDILEIDEFDFYFLCRKIAEETVKAIIVDRETMAEKMALEWKSTLVQFAMNYTIEECEHRAIAWLGK